MTACLPCGQENSSVNVITPLNNISKGGVFDLLPTECLYAGMALKFGGYPVLLFKLPHVDVSMLKSSLSTALQRHPWFAGRLNVNTKDGLFEGCVFLNHAGVPFKVVRSEEKTAPERLEETSMMSFGDFENPRQVQAGLAPVMTVRLTVFKDGSGILGICRSHALADGTYTWAFVADWAAAARGQPLGGDVTNARKAISDTEVTDMNEIQNFYMTDIRCGFAAEKKPFRYTMLMAMMRAMDMIWYAGLAPELGRARILFSNADLDRIKRAATPPRGSKGDGWVTTQEAMSAHLLLSLGRALLTEGKADAVTGVDTWIDCRKHLGLPADAAGGIGFGVMRYMVEGLLDKKLWEVAQVIHEEAKLLTPEVAKKEFGIAIGMFRQGLGADLAFSGVQAQFNHATKGKFDLLLKLNNQSKRKLPDFGKAGGAASSVLTNAGPSLLLPVNGGVELFLVDDVFNGASNAKKAEAIRLIGDVASWPVGSDHFHAAKSWCSQEPEVPETTGEDNIASKLDADSPSIVTAMKRRLSSSFVAPSSEAPSPCKEEQEPAPQAPSLVDRLRSRLNSDAVTTEEPLKVEAEPQMVPQSSMLDALRSRLKSTDGPLEEPSKVADSEVPPAETSFIQRLGSRLRADSNVPAPLESPSKAEATC